MKTLKNFPSTNKGNMVNEKSLTLNQVYFESCSRKVYEVFWEKKAHNRF